MPIRGDIITAQEFNLHVDGYEKYWADAALSASITDVDIQPHTFGWGQSSVEPRVSVNDVIKSEDYNRLVAQINAGVYHMTYDATQLLPMKAPGVPILAEHMTDLTEKYEYVHANRFDLAPELADIEQEQFNVPVNTLWQNSLQSKLNVKFDSYNQARYFFNSGSKLLIDFALIGNNPGILGWEQWRNVFASIGQIRIGANYVYTDGDVPGFSNAGFYQLIGKTSTTVLWQGTGCTLGNGAYGGYGGYGGYGCYGSYGGYGGYSGYGSYSSRMITIAGIIEQGTDGSLSLILTIRLTDTTVPTGTYLNLPIEMDAGYMVASFAPVTLGQPPFTEGVYQYQFIRRETPSISWYAEWQEV